MKVRKLKDGELVQVGDRIRCEHRGWGTKWETVSRVTPKYAFVKYNEKAEGKYKRAYRDMLFQPLPRATWCMTNYSAWRPVDGSSVDQEER